MAEHTDFGKIAEDLATEFLQGKGYKILVRNFRNQKAEIDIIAEYDNKIIIVEVKARGTDFFMQPHEAVNKKKIKLLVACTDAYLNKNQLDKEVRFDIVSILKNKNSPPIITHLENAFEAMDAI